MLEGYYKLLDQNTRHLLLIVPELLVTAGFLLGLIFDCIAPEERRKSTAYICLLFLVAAMWVNVTDWNTFVHEKPRLELKRVEIPKDPSRPVVWEAKPVQSMRSDTLFTGMVARDTYGMYFKFVILLGTAVSLLMALNAKELAGNHRGEFFLLLTATCLGGMFLCSATNLLMIYLSLETLSILSYAMAGYLRQDRKSAEAGIKYAIYGAMASGVMIFGMSYLYGLTGSLNLTGPDGVVAKWFELRATAAPSMQGAYLAVLAMVFVGLLYKIAAAPFHYWSPDVYEGAPTTATGFFSVVPKAAGFAVLVRVLVEFFPIGSTAGFGYHHSKMEVALGAIAIVTMTLGNLAALGQSNAKRMLAYSSVAHAGYMVAGLSMLDDGRGPAAVLYYLLVYLFMNLGAFMVLVALENFRGSCDLKDLKGAIRREPMLATTLVIFLFSLTGLPPLAGFTGKYLIMVKLAERGNWLMVLVIGLNSVISLYYYMRIAKAVAIDPPEAAATTSEPTPAVFGFLAAGKVAALVLLFVYFKPVYDLCMSVVDPLR
ncbi:MAG: NADH-quinone oxidoreductase subunit N [Planctomycetota bacterium]|nr:NADH-quinone oxidoreductase subunit N [Planctomycetota bacterium]